MKKLSEYLFYHILRNYEKVSEGFWAGANIFCAKGPRGGWHKKVVPKAPKMRGPVKMPQSEGELLKISGTEGGGEKIYFHSFLTIFL